VNASGVRLIAFDSDGTLTDRGITWTTDGEGVRRFDVRDGLAMQWCLRAGLPVVVISGKVSRALDHRLCELGVPGFQGVLDKVDCLERYAAGLGIALDECAFVGDDLPDVPAMRAVGYPMAVADAHPLVLALASWTSLSPGGFGAAREVIEHVLQARGLWSSVLDHYGASNLAAAIAPSGRFE
jgi:3-deoxy-D-manno-octulosonate 8-phosphate phosphatase (KDO 8-P phosphatase)